MFKLPLIREHGRYDLNIILELSKEFPDTFIQPDDLNDYLTSEVMWSKSLKKMVSPMEIYSGKVSDDDNHMLKIKTAPEHNPIIISYVMRPNNPPTMDEKNQKIIFGLHQINGCYDVIFGIYHLMHCIFIKKMAYIPVKVIPFDILYKAKIWSLYTLDHDGRYVIDISNILES